jgi:hypothetical protein
VPRGAQCTAVDDGGDQLTFNPQLPGTVTKATVGGSSLDRPVAVACPSTSQCTALDTGGYAATFNPASTSTAHSTRVGSNGEELNAITCPSAAQCVLVSYLGRAYEGDPTTPSSFTLESIPGADTLNGVACQSTAQCVAVDDVGDAFVQGGVPANATPPTISGTATQGQTLTDVNGTWSNNPTSFSYQWEDCDAAGGACTPIPGATGQSYGLGAGDVGDTVVVQETAVNPAGAGAPVLSAPTGVVAAVPTAAPTTTAPAPTATPQQTAGVTFGNQRITASTVSAKVCVKNPQRLIVTLRSAKLAGSKAAKPTFISAAVFIGTGIKHVRHLTVRTGKGKGKTVTTYTANAVAHRVPATLHLSLKGLKRGRHTLKIRIAERETVQRRGHRHRAIVTKTFTETFTVC